MDEVLYPLGESSFKTIRERNYLYVDKTHFIKPLLKNSYYFLSRPRRFGKSLFISTLEQFFLGEKKLFEGLSVANLDWDWEEYPIIRIDLSNGSFSRADGLTERLYEIIDKIEAKYDINPKGRSPRARFNNLIGALHLKYNRQVVILIDEYEKPLLDSVFKSYHEQYIGEIHDFYSVLKDNSENIKFLFITGVTRFGNLNIFSGLNNLYDISLEDEFADICGINELEIDKNLRIGIQKLADKRQWSYDQALSELKRNYDGYHFAENLLDVYNPFSLLGSLRSGKISFSWFESGSASFLVKLIKEKSYDLSDIENIEVSPSRLKSIGPNISDPIPLLYQSGYLTIKSYSEEEGLYRLGYPNIEVKKGMLEVLIPTYLNQAENSLTIPSIRIRNRLADGNPNDVMIWLKGFFSRLPFDLHFKYEKEFQFVICCVFNLIGLEQNVKVEQHTSKGSIDMEIEIDNYVYIIEFKIEGTAEKALKQIRERGYCDKFLGLNKNIFLIGVKFDPKHHSIEDYIIEKDMH